MSRLIIDSETNDSRIVLGAPPWSYPPLGPHDLITINAGALNSHGLDSLEIRAGIGPNVVYDHTLEGPPTADRLEIVGLTETYHAVYGAVDSLDLTQSPDHVADATITGPSGQVVYQIHDENVRQIVFSATANLEFHVDAPEVTLSERSGAQLFSGPGLTEVSVGIPSQDAGDYQLHVAGEKSLNLVDVLLPVLSIVGDPSRPDRVRINVRF